MNKRTSKNTGSSVQKQLTVSYRRKFEQFKDVDGGDYKWASATYSTSGVKRYNECLMVLCGVTGVARDLMDWLTIQMSPNNKVYNNEDTRNEFIAFVRRSKDKADGLDYKEPSHRTLKEAFKRLHGRGLLLKSIRGVYMVNPEYFMNPNLEDRREKLLRLVLEFRNNINTTLTLEVEEDAAEKVKR